MFRKLLEQRTVIAMLIATGVGALGVHAYPIDRGNVYLQLIELRSPAVFRACLRLRDALVYDAVLRAVHTYVSRDNRRLPLSGQRTRDRFRSTCPERRPSPTLVLGETHFETTMDVRRRRRG